MSKEKVPFKKGDKKRYARKLRNITGMPARTICRIMKNISIVTELNVVEMHSMKRSM
jgi:hypothetical protein